MGSKNNSPPPAPDPAATAAAQGAVNKETAVAQAGLNMTNQVTPTGTLTYRQIGNWEDGTPRYESTTALTPAQQALLNSQQAISQQALDTGQTLFGNVQQQAGQAPPAFDENYRQQQLAQMLSRTQGQRDQQQQALEAQLANQGVTLGSEAYRNAMDQFGRTQNDYLIAADLASGGEARNAYATALQGRSQPINELSALLGLGQVQNPQFQNTPQTGISPTDYMGAVNMGYQGQLNSYNQQQQNNRSTLGSLAGLAGTAGWLAFSDERLKTDIVEVGSTKVDVPVYEYRYKWEEPGTKHIGVMAQELEKVRPDAVHQVGAYKAVDYSKVA